MLNSNAVITFDGLMVFCFSPKTCQDLPDVRTRCKIGILHETGEDIHEFSIKVYKELLDGSSTPAALQEIGMTPNPRIFDQSALRNISSFHLYVGDDAQAPPGTGSVVRDQSFDTVLNLNGEDFYQGIVNILWGNFTPFYATTGIFSGVNKTGDAEFCRVSKDVLHDIQTSLARPNDWYTLLDPDKRMLESFARKMRSEIEIPQGKYLFAKAETSPGVFETVFRLPHPSTLGIKGYVLEISNLDPDNTVDKTSPEYKVKNCANFLHISKAVESPNLNPKPEYGLTYNFDFVFLQDDGLNDPIERSDEACCIGCEGG